VPRILVALLSLAASTASALTFTTHFSPTRGNPSYVISPSNASIVYAINAGVLYGSDDGGVSFAARSSVSGPNVVVDPTNAQVVYDAGGLRRSDDGGATWKALGGEAYGTIVFHPANPSELHLVAGCSSSHPALAGVFVSHDRGDTWSHETSECTLDIAFDPLPPYTEYRAGIFGSGASLPARQVVADARTPQFRYGLSSFYRNIILFSDSFGLT